MLRKLIVIVCVLALATPALAAVYVTNGANPQNITISLTIGCFTNIWWAPTGSGYSWDLDDQTIVFNDIVQNGSNQGDWWSPVLTGAYGAATKASTDAFATDYFESYDAALFWMESNCNTQMVLTSSGDLMEPGGAKLPTWYTIALTNNMNCTYNVDCGFIDGGTRHSDGLIPMDGMGCYPDDVDTDNVLRLYGGPFYPNQFSFPMEVGGVGTVYTGNFTAFAQGTVLFHGRVLRSGIADPGGAYTTTLQVQFF